MPRFRNGDYVRYLQLIDRKLRLSRVLTELGERLMYCDHLEAEGPAYAFRLHACADTYYRSLPLFFFFVIYMNTRRGWNHH